MKINEISIDEFGVCQNLRIDNFGNGLNLLFGNSGSGKTTLARFLNGLFFGFNEKDACYGSHAELEHRGLTTRLIRNTDNNNRLHFSNHSFSDRQFVDSNTFNLVFHVDGRQSTNRSSELAGLLRDNLNVPVGPSALGNDQEQIQLLQQRKKLQGKMEHLSNQIAALESERNRLVRQIEDEESSYQSRRRDVEDQINVLSQQIGVLNPSNLQLKIDSVDREIADLRLKIDDMSEQYEYVSRPYKASDGLATLYRRLDEIESQIRRWRMVHTDVQNQRVRLKDEMVVWNELTMESTTHPYHRSRQILNEIEAKLVTAESSIDEFRNKPVVDNTTSDSMANHLAGLCGQIRQDLYSLCDELGTQYKNVRHRSAAAELKRMRRCYHEIGDNIDALIEHRRSIIEEIRHIDPAGALAITRAENEFCQCAQHEGYLQARRRFVGEFEQNSRSMEIVQPDVSAEKQRLYDLEQQRSQFVRELVRHENQLSELKSQRKSLLVEFDRSDSLVDFSEVRTRLEKTQYDLNSLVDERTQVRRELDWQMSIRPEPANQVLEFARENLQKLTNHELQSVWLSSNIPYINFEVENRHGNRLVFENLSSGQQQQVILSICLAVAEHYCRIGQEMPVLLDDVFVNLDPDLISATVGCLIEFCQRGHQVIALTSDKTASDLAIRSGATHIELPSFDLPQTSVSPVVPLWSPERLPDYPPQRSERNHGGDLSRELRSSLPKIATGFSSHPPVLADQPADASPQNHSVVRGNRLTENSPLNELGIASEHVNSLNRAGFITVGQLLNVNPTENESLLRDVHVTNLEMDNWQSIAWLLLCVPALDLTDAEMLIALGISEPEQLESTHVQQLLDRISRHLNTASSFRQSNRNRSYSRSTINNWYDSLSRTRSQWRLPSGYSRRTRWGQSSRNSRGGNRSSTRQAIDLDRARTPRRERRPQRPERMDFASEMRERNSNSRRSNRNEPSAPRQKYASEQNSTNSIQLKFYLEQSDQLEAAPSIGPKTAERFAKISVTTVGEFLTQTAESMASKINYKRITADVIRQWQHQARMVCRIPNLRGHDAQLLVACDITEPEDLAERNADKLFAIIQPFAESKDGLKIIRGGKQPDLEEIKDWINWAQQTRSLQAA